MAFYLPTYDECVNLVKTKGELSFYELKYTINNYKISIFNYRLTQYSDFYDVFDARELRGITFVFNPDGTLFKRYLMLHKFWNINQVAETQYNIIKDLKIKSINNKEDGSLISFIKLPNGEILSRTKMGIDNFQSIESFNIYKNSKNLIQFIEYCFDNDMIPTFEYVSFNNKIVLNYDESRLILLRVRHLNTGEYVDLKSINTFGIEIVKEEEYNSIDELIDLCKTLTNKEGWVVQFENDLFIKIKTEDYCSKHHLLTELSNREDYIIECIINENLDDIIGQLNPINDKNRIEWIKNIEHKVHKWMNFKKDEIDELLKDYDGDMKKFAIKYVKTENFHFAALIIKGKDYVDVFKNHLKIISQKIGTSRDFLNSIK
jgi:T4 RnlA family RNA ligase